MRYPHLAEFSSGIPSGKSRLMSSQQNKKIPADRPLQKAFVIFGGNTSERQVSLMSGTNVWLNLRASADVSF